MSETVLIIAAHPDDEVLGVGGTAARHASQGDDVHVLIMAEGVTSRSTIRNVEQHDANLSDLRQSAATAAGLLGTRPPRFTTLPDNRMDSLDLLDVVKQIETHVSEIRPTIVYTHHGGDLNVDHLIVHRATLTACRPLPGHVLRAIYTFETLSSTEWGSPDSGTPFQPTHFVNVSGTLAQKITALRCYEAEMRPFPHARSLEAVQALARLRGAQSGLAAAEAFGVIRSFWS
ncbi:PIG-L deacetylase family protein [Azospirillum soli]|uniref:PIG-L deacetylase family protein n=1 Tax=Azospirillum soli TaxID=1304799 RepID=UPI001AEB921C|nr:PIG-L deacetylase family protein [Azospirillum soli]MBP2316062.1 LmbE family N-acetylglucosaminyl deacetylase [Azospirillum soli]